MRIDGRDSYQRLAEAVIRRAMHDVVIGPPDVSSDAYAFLAGQGEHAEGVRLWGMLSQLDIEAIQRTVRGQTRDEALAQYRAGRAEIEAREPPSIRARRERWRRNQARRRANAEQAS